MKTSPPKASGTRYFLNRNGAAEKVLPQGICKVLEECGSCPSLDVSYREQLSQKTKHLKHLAKAQGFENISIKDCAASVSKLGYRHAAKLVISEDVKDTKRWIKIGLYKPMSHQVVDVGRCPVQSEKINQITAFLRGAIKDFKISVYNPRTKKGLLRYVAIRSTKKRGDSLVTFVTSSKEKESLGALAREMVGQLGCVEGVIQHFNDSTGNEIFNASPQEPDKLLAGKDILHEELAGVKLRVSSSSFLQINPFVAETLYHRIADIVGPKPQDNVLDLYCGVGIIALKLAPHVSQVFGIEENQIAIEDAKFNALENDAKEAQFFAGRAEDVLHTLVGTKIPKNIDIITINPSRRGVSDEVLKALPFLGARAILYMSCLPESLMRDLKILGEFGYKPRFFEPHDMFPGTPHYETLVLLTKGE